MIGRQAKRGGHTQPIPVREVVSTAIARLTEQHQQRAAVDFPTWKRIVGERMARHAQPTTLRQGRLTVRASDSALLYELSLRSPELLAGLRQAIPDRPIHEVGFSLGEVRW